MTTRVLFCIALVAAFTVPVGTAGQELCKECEDDAGFCGYYEHHTKLEIGYGVTGPFHAYICRPGWCIPSLDGHGLCYPTDDELDDEQIAVAVQADAFVMVALDTENEALLAWVLKRAAGRAEYVATRNAIQIVDCRGLRVANFPVLSERMAGLLRADSRSRSGI